MAENQSFIRPEEFWRTVDLRANQTVVHLGCGAGFYLIPAAAIVGKNGKAIGVDLLQHLLAEAEGRAQREGVAEQFHTIRANLEQPKGSTLPDRSTDVVLVANILHQSDPTKIITEAARIVKPEGIVVVVEWNTAATPFGPPVEKRLSESDVAALAGELGLTQKKAWQPSPYHFGLVFASAA